MPEGVPAGQVFAHCRHCPTGGSTDTIVIHSQHADQGLLHIMLMQNFPVFTCSTSNDTENYR